MAIYDSSKSKIYLKEYDLSAYTTSFEIGGGVGVRDVTTFADTSEASIIGPQSPTASWEGLFDEGASGSDAAMADLIDDTSVKPVTIWPTGISTKGDVGYGGDGRFANATVKSSVGNAVSMSAEFNIGRMSRLKLLNTGLVTYTGDYDAGDNDIDDGAATSRGGAFFIHITAISGTWSILLSDSANGSSWATAASLPVEEAGLVSVDSVQGYVKIFTGDLRRYVDIDVTENVSGSLTMICGYARF